MLKKRLKCTFGYAAMLAFTILSVWFMDLMTVQAFQRKIISLVLLLCFFLGFFYSKYFLEVDAEEKSKGVFNLHAFVSIFALFLVLVRYLKPLTGFSFPGTTLYYSTDGSVVGYYFEGLHLHYVLSFLILRSTLYQLEHQLTFNYPLQNLLLALISPALFFTVTLTSGITHLVFKKTNADRIKKVSLILTGISSILILFYKIKTDGFNLREDLSLFQTSAAMSVIIINAVSFILISFQQKQRLIKRYFAISLFLLSSVILLPQQLLISFNSVIYGISFFLFLSSKDSDNENPFALYTKNVITDFDDSLSKIIEAMSPSCRNVKISADALSCIVIGNLIGSNRKLNETKRIFEEIENDCDLNFELLMVKGILSEVSNNPDATEIFKAAKKIARGNVELYVSEYFIDSKSELLDSIKEDLLYDLCDEAEKEVEKYISIRNKLTKLPN